MSKISELYIAFGANLSNPSDSFRKAASALETQGFVLKALSSLWQSPAWPAGSAQPDYVNAVARAERGGSAREALAALHLVEAEMGRIRGERNAPRTLDLDLLDFGGQVMDAPDITLPHPRMMVRGFVLFPLLEVAPIWVHPVSQMSAFDAMARLTLSDVAPMTWLGRWPRKRQAEN